MADVPRSESRAFANPRRLSAAVVVVAAIIGLVAVLMMGGGGHAAAAPPTGIAVTRGDITVTVGGVGQIVQAGRATQASPTSTAAPGGETPGLPVVPQTAGRIAALLVSPGQHLSEGEPIAVIDDGGLAAAAIDQARLDVAAARLELSQKRGNDPGRGIPATRAELVAGRLAVSSARARLAVVRQPARPAEVTAARLDLKRAEADLETLLGGRPEIRARAVQIAEQEVVLSQQKLDRILALPDPADVAAARADLARAEADLEALVRSDRTQPVTLKEITAAKAAIAAARLKLARVEAPAAPADVSAARLELERARAELQRLVAGPSTAQLAAARAAVAAARARLRQILSPAPTSDVLAARAEIRRAEADLGVLRARGGPASASERALARVKVAGAEERLARALDAAGPLTVRAPRAGTVIVMLTTLGAHVDATTPVVAMADLSRLEARVELSEFDIAQVKRRQRAIVSVDALGGKSIRGAVRFTALAGANSGGIVTFPVLVELADSRGLKPGMNVSIRIVVARRTNVLRLPLEAVTQDGGEATVLVPDASGTPVARVVELGLANNKVVEITKGLRPGQRVVVESAGGGGGE